MTRCSFTENMDNCCFRSYFLRCMDTRFLETLVCVIESGSIAEAARRLDLTASTVAQRVHAVEGELGVRLVFRSGRNVRPTEAAMTMLDHARRFVSGVRDLRSVLANGEPSGEFRLGAMPTTISGLLPDLLSIWSDKYPRVEVRMVRATSSELYERVIDGDLDAAIIAQPPFAIPKTCDWRLLREEPLMLFVPASLRTRDPHAILKSEPFIRNERNTWAGRLVEGYLRQAGIRPQEKFELAGIDLIAVLVDRGLGVSLMHDSGPLWLSGLSVKKIPLVAPRFARLIGLLWSRATFRIRLVDTFLQEATKVFSEPSTPRRRPSTQKHKRHR